MSTKTLDTDTALALLEQVVEEAGPDYRYQYTEQEIEAFRAWYLPPDESYDINSIMCKYVDDGAPRCIVGKVLAKWDPEGWTSLHTVKANGPADALGAFWDRDAEGYSEHITMSAATVLREAQLSQDRGEPWATAMQAAKAAAQAALRAEDEVSQ